MGLCIHTSWGEKLRAGNKALSKYRPTTVIAHFEPAEQRPSTKTALSCQEVYPGKPFPCITFSTHFNASLTDQVPVFFISSSRAEAEQACYRASFVQGLLFLPLCAWSWKSTVMMFIGRRARTKNKDNSEMTHCKMCIKPALFFPHFFCKRKHSTNI